MKLVKRAARALLGDYDIYRILAVEPPQLSRMPRSAYRFGRLDDSARLAHAADAELRALTTYAGNDAACFIAEDDSGALVAACWFWWGPAGRKPDFWPLRHNEAKLVQITTAASQRNRGIAQALIGYGCSEMFRAGFERLYARVWHSNAPSLAAFRRAGWRPIALVIDIEPFGKRLRFVTGT